MLLRRLRFWRKLARSSYYRRHPLEAARLIRARRLLARHRVPDRDAFLASLGLDPQGVVREVARWRPVLEPVLAGKSIAGVSEDDGIVLYGLVRAVVPEYVVETGVAEGVSTSFIGAALLDNGRGRLVSIDLPPAALAARTLREDGSRYRWAEKGIAHLVPEAISTPLADRWQLRLGDVREVLPRLLDELPGLDLFFHDDLHIARHMRWEYELVWPRLSPGGVLVSDDANHGWTDFVREHRLAVDPLVNFDGLTVARKR